MQATLKELRLVDLPPQNSKFDVNYRYVFLVKWIDPENLIVRKLCLQCYPYDNSVQLFDMNRSRMYVRRAFYPLDFKKLTLGTKIKLFGKIIFVENCSAETRDTLFHRLESNFALIKPVPFLKAIRIIATIEKMGFKIINIKKTIIDKEFGDMLYATVTDITMKALLIAAMMGSEIIGLEIEKSDCIDAFTQAMGDKDPKLAAPGTIRRLFGDNRLSNAIHGCQSTKIAKSAIHDFFYGPRSYQFAITPTLKNCTCGIIKPTAVGDGLIGRILEHIVTGGFTITCLKMFRIDILDAREFLELYKGVLIEFEDLVWELASGACLVMEIISDDANENSVKKFRKMCGPMDPELCRMLHPTTIRAKYGFDEVQNAIHCTDLEEEGVNEVDYFFNLITNRDRDEMYEGNM